MKPKVFNMTSRTRQVLEAVVAEYLESGQPVGSGTIVEKHLPSISSATARNAMYSLVEMGFLEQPHRSAGRMPTKLALRYYVDEVLKSSRATVREKSKILKEFSNLYERPEEIMKETSQKLSLLSGQAGIIIAPNINAVRLKHIEFISLSNSRMMAVIVPACGVIRNRIFRFGKPIKTTELVKVNNFLNENFAGMTLGEIREAIIAMMKEEKANFDALMAKALMLGKEAFTDENSEEDLYVEGRGLIIEKQEFANVDELKAIYSAMEKKSLILKLVDMTIKAKGINVTFGTETNINEAEGLSLITGSYGRGDTIMGQLGILGPVRMDYKTLIPLVECTAELVSDIMEQ